MNCAIRTYDLSKRYRRTPVLERVNLEVPPGSIYGLVGANGAGKTTTIKVLMNLLVPSSGHCEVMGADSRRLSAADFAQIGYVSENQEMPDWMTVGYFLEHLGHFYPTWDTAMAAGLLRRFELPPGRKLRELSHGMRMKAALASSLAYRPRLMVLDEPFTGLDAVVRDELIEGILTRDGGTTIFISSHDLTEIESFVTHIGYLDQGRLHFSEELASVSARFREMALSFASAPPLPKPWPEHWLLPQTAGNAIRFIESRYDGERTAAQIRGVFPDAQEVTATAMPLRSIFVALVKAGRKGVQ
ncbi:MAG TPA: ABC transporter ATP-binding protein [Bryobacteraceae bacterium]|nr:ABC transporter ATP-binding protein [Bryobacteraceae bacterium]